MLEHFEGLGNLWGGLVGDPQIVLLNLKDAMAVSELVYDTPTYTGLIEKINDKIQVLHSIEKTKEGAVYVSSAPLLSGVESDLLLSDSYAWENAVEGEFECVFNYDGGEQSFFFFDPRFVIDLQKFTPKTRHKVSLSAIALDISQLESQEIKINEGPSYEIFLKEFLEKNPDKTKDDYKEAIFHITTDHFRAFLPSKYATECDVCGQIEGVDETSLYGQKLSVLKLNLAHKNDESDPFLLNVYALQDNLGGYTPQVGDGIQSRILFCGHIL